MNWNMTDRIEYLIELKGIRKKDLATEIGISPSSLSKYLSGATPMRVDILSKFSRCLDTSADYLLGLTDSISIDNQKLTEQERLLLVQYRHCNETGKNIIRENSTTTYKYHSLLKNKFPKKS